MYIMEVPSCHTRDLRFYSVNGEDSLNNLSKRLVGINVCFRQNVLAALVIMNWSGRNLAAGRPLYFSKLKVQTGHPCLLILTLGSTASH